MTLAILTFLSATAVEHKLDQTLSYRDLRLTISHDQVRGEAYGTYYLDVGRKRGSVRRVAFNACYGAQIDRIWSPGAKQWHILVWRCDSSIRDYKIFAYDPDGSLKEVSEIETRGRLLVNKNHGIWTVREVFPSLRYCRDYSGSDLPFLFPSKGKAVETRRIFDVHSGRYDLVAPTVGDARSKSCARRPTPYVATPSGREAGSRPDRPRGFAGRR